jgi:hypothetical protein
MKASTVLVACLALLLPSMAAAQEPAPALGPPAGDEASRPAQTITFYGHVFGNGLDGQRGINGPMPANTLPPVGDGLFAIWQSDGCGILPVEDPTTAVPVVGGEFQGGPDCDKDPVNKLAIFLTAGPVQVHQFSDFNYTALHNEHGRAKDVYLDTTKDIHAWFYAAADFFSYPLLCQGGLGPDLACPLPSWGWDPGVIPNFVVEATLYTAVLGDYGQGASEPPPIAAGLAGAEVLAKGSVGPVTLQTGLPGSPNAMEFDVNLGKPAQAVVPKDRDLFLVYSWYEQMPTGKMGLSYMKPWAGEQFPVRFQLPVRNPFDVELVIPQFLHSKLLVHGVLSSPWGSYDVDLKTVDIEVRDPADSPVSLEHLVRAGDYSVAHGAHFKPVNVTWVWDYAADRAKPGTYTATVRGCNLQHSSCGSTESRFTINADGSPGDIVVGRSGQVTASEGQLRQITQGSNLTANEARVPVVAEPPAARKAPGPEPLLLAASVALLALAARARRQP